MQAVNLLLLMANTEILPPPPPPGEFIWIDNTQHYIKDSYGNAIIFKST